MVIKNENEAKYEKHKHLSIYSLKIIVVFLFIVKLLRFLNFSLSHILV